MTVRFLADEDLAAGIIQGLRSREAAVDILDVKNADLRRIGDPALLELAAQQDRIPITHDRNTMTRHFRERLRDGKPSPGILVLSHQPNLIGEIVEWLLLIWAASQAEESRNQIVVLRQGLGPAHAGTVPG